MYIMNGFIFISVYDFYSLLSEGIETILNRSSRLTATCYEEQIAKDREADAPYR